MLEQKFYVYAIFRPNGSPCYIGHGCGRRWRSHRSFSTNPLLAELYREFGDLPSVKIRTNLHERQAFECERALIDALGRLEFGGPLVNRYRGSVPFKKNMSATVREKIASWHRGKIVSKQTREKLSAAGKIRLISDETRARLRVKIFTAETRAKMSASRLGRKHSEETRAKIGAAHAKRKLIAKSLIADGQVLHA